MVKATAGSNPANAQEAVHAMSDSRLANRRKKSFHQIEIAVGMRDVATVKKGKQKKSGAAVGKASGTPKSSKRSPKSGGSGGSGGSPNSPGSASRSPSQLNADAVSYLTSPVVVGESSPWSADGSYMPPKLTPKSGKMGDYTRQKVAPVTREEIEAHIIREERRRKVEMHILNSPTSASSTSPSLLQKKLEREKKEDRARERSHSKAKGRSLGFSLAAAESEGQDNVAQRRSAITGEDDTASAFGRMHQLGERGGEGGDQPTGNTNGRRMGVSEMEMGLLAYDGGGGGSGDETGGASACEHCGKVGGVSVGNGENGSGEKMTMKKKKKSKKETDKEKATREKKTVREKEKVGGKKSKSKKKIEVEKEKKAEEITESVASPSKKGKKGKGKKQKMSDAESGEGVTGSGSAVQGVSVLRCEHCGKIRRRGAGLTVSINGGGGKAGNPTGTPVKGSGSPPGSPTSAGKSPKVYVGRSKSARKEALRIEAASPVITEEVEEEDEEPECVIRRVPGASKSEKPKGGSKACHLL